MTPLDRTITVSLGVCSHRVPVDASGNPEVFCRHKKGRRLAPPVPVSRRFANPQARRVSTKFWPLALVQLSWLVEIIRQLKLTGVWRINEVPWISTEVAPVMV